MIANQLNNSPDNRIVSLFTAPPDETAVYKFTGSGYNSLTFVPGVGWDDGGTGQMGMTLNPGEGVFIFAPTAFTHTFVGEVALSSTVNVGRGYQVISSALPQSLPLDAAPPAGLGFPVGDGDFVYEFNGAGYDSYEFIAGVGWNPSAPTPAIGESFFFFSPPSAPATRSWTRNFSVSGQ